MIRPAERLSSRPLLLLLLILVLAAVFRFADLHTAPAGSDGDVAWFGINALDWLDRGIWPYYVREQYAPEPLTIYLIGLAIRLNGVALVTPRLVTATSGVLFVALLFPATWWLLAGSPRPLRARAGLLAALGGAVSLHAMSLSRTGLQSPQLPGAIALLTWAVAWAWQRGGAGRWALAGAVLGLSQYIYIPGRLLPVVVGLWAAHSAWAERQRWRSQWRGWLLMAAVALVVMLPNLITFLSTPEAFTGRADTGTAQTGGWVWQYAGSAAGGLPGLLLGKLGLILLALGIHWDGPFTVMGRPMLEPLYFLGFLVALGAGVRWPRRVGLAWPLLAIPVLVAPDLISGGVVEAHALHQIGALPFVYMLAGIGLAYGWEALSARLPRPAGRGAAAAVLLAVGIVPSLWGLHRYLNVVVPAQYADPETGWRREQTDVDLSRRLLAEPDRAYLLPYAEYSRANFAWLLSAVYRERRSAIDAGGVLRIPALPDRFGVLEAADPYRPRHDAQAAHLDRRLWVLLVGDQALLLPPLSQEQMAALDQFLNAAQREAIRDRSQTEIGTLYSGPTPRELFAPRPVVDYPLEATFGDGAIRLLGYTLPDTDLTPGAATYVTLFWRVGSPPPGEDYEVFVQVWDDAGQSVAGAHDFPYNGMYRTRIWRPDEVVATHHRLEIPEGLPVGRYTLALGLFRQLHNERVPVTGEDADAANRVVLAPDLRHPPPAAFQPLTPPPWSLRFGDTFAVTGLALTLDGAPQEPDRTWTASPGQTVEVDIAWEALQRPARDYSLFLHLSASPDAPPTAQTDLPMGGALPSGAWRAGDRLLDRLTLALPDDLPLGSYSLWFGVYDWQTGERLTPELDGAAQADGRVRLGIVVVRQRP